LSLTIIGLPKTSFKKSEGDFLVVTVVVVDVDGVAVDDDEEEEEEEEEEEDFALSDVESDNDLEIPDIIPYQKLTIDNHSALTQGRKRIALPIQKMTFSEHQTITTSEPVDIPDIDDDLNRELAFYKQALTAAKSGRELLKKEGVSFSRPTDYFAEMMKDDEHMGKIKEKLLGEAEGKKRAQEARKLRDLKKFGKQVQVAKLQEREKAKKDTLDKIQILKRKRQGADTDMTHENDMFDIALDEETKDARRQQRGGPNVKRQKRDQKYGFGGKKRFGKSNDAISSGDMSGFTRNNKSGFGRGGGGAGRGGRGGRGGKAPRMGKSKRAAKR